MLETALDRLTDSDVFAAIDFLDQENDPKKAVAAYSQLITKLYWENKNLPAVIGVAVAGIQYATAASRRKEPENPALATELLGSAKAMSYNLASFTWPGWDEPGIAIGASDVRLGLEAAKTNLRLAWELSKAGLPICRAYWMLGAQYLANGMTDQARHAFNESARYAQNAEVQSEKLLAEGCAQITTLAENPEDAGAKARLEEIKTQLQPLEHGNNFIEQLVTAAKVFCPERDSS